MLLHTEVREPKLPVTTMGQSGNNIELMLASSMSTVRHTDDSSCASIWFCGEEFFRW
jgi:hypothetical protein